jgi:hypothetical protein
VYVFTGNRKARLREYAQAQPSIGGAVFAAVGFFLNDKEKDKDPAGHAVYKNLQAKTNEAFDAGWLELLEGQKDSIDSLTVVGPASSKKTMLLGENDLRKIISNWSDAVSLCEKMTKRSQRGLQAAEKALSRLASNESGKWRLGDLVEMVLQLTSQPASLEPLDDRTIASKEDAPSRYAEEEDTIHVKSQKTSDGIAAMSCHAKVKLRLSRLWDWILAYFKANRCFPKQSEIAKQFGQDRKRVNDDYVRLRPLLVSIWGIKPDI